MNKADGYIDVDQLQSETTLEEAATKCGVTLTQKGTGNERRIDCPFGCKGDHCGRNEIAINTENPQKVFQCHAYGCGFRGNLLTLMHGWVNGRQPTGGKLKGEEFQKIKKVLSGTITQLKSKSISETTNRSEAAPSEKPNPAVRNVALIDSPDPKVRELHNIDEKFVTDIAKMNPAAAAYVRKHPCLTPESMKKWRVGYLPNDGGGDKRGWSLRGSIVYPVFAESGKALCWVGRDVHYEQKETEFEGLGPTDRVGRNPPAKHRFPKGFHRGQEFFGQQASRLKEPGYRDFIAKHGLIIVEGFNDVINLDNLGIPAIAIMSNRITEMQLTKIILWASQLANGRVTIMFDSDPLGIEGAKDTLYRLIKHGINPRLLENPPRKTNNLPELEPESIDREFIKASFR